MLRISVEYSVRNHELTGVEAFIKVLEHEDIGRFMTGEASRVLDLVYDVRLLLDLRRQYTKDVKSTLAKSVTDEQYLPAGLQQ